MSSASEFAGVNAPSNGTKVKNAVNLTKLFSRRDCAALCTGARRGGVPLKQFKKFSCKDSRVFRLPISKGSNAAGTLRECKTY